MLPDGTWYHSSDMDTKEIIRRIKDGAGWDDLKDLVPPISKQKSATSIRRTILPVSKPRKCWKPSRRTLLKSKGIMPCLP